MPDSSVVSEWLRFAKADLDSAWHLQTMVPVPIEIACYHCQQSAEKALKAFLLANGCEVKKTHDVRFLCNECKTVNADFAQIETMCSRVTVYGSQSRYPFALEIESEDMQSIKDKKDENEITLDEYIIKNPEEKDENNEEITNNDN